MTKSIDLHGKSHEDAIIIVEEYLLMNSFDNSLDLELITGNSPVLQNKIINNILKNMSLVTTFQIIIEALCISQILK